MIKIKPFFLWIFILGIFGVSLCGADKHVVKILDSGEKKVKKNNASRNDWINRRIVLENSKLKVEVGYDRYKDNQGCPGGSEYVSPILLNLFQSSPGISFNVKSKNGLNLARKPFQLRLLEGQIDRKGVDIDWDLPEGKVNLRLILNAGDNKIFGKFKVDVPTEYTINFSLYPGGLCLKKDKLKRRVFSNNIMSKPSEKIEFTLGKSSWFLLYDQYMDPEKRTGKGALGCLWVSHQGQSVSLSCGSYCSGWNIKCKKNVKDVDFILWPFYMTPNREAKEIITEQADGLIKKLAKEDENLFSVEKKVTINKKSTSQGVSIRYEQAGDIYGIDNVVMENKFLRVVVSPRNGGRVISCVWKKHNKEFAYWDQKGKQGGLLSLIPSGSGYPGEFVGKEFKFSEIINTPEKCIVRFECKGSQQNSKGLLFVKELILEKNSPELVAVLKIINESFTLKTAGLRIHNWLPIGSNEKKANAYTTTVDGVKYIQKKTINKFPNAWMAYIDPEDQLGFAGVPNYHQLKSKWFWQMEENSSMEWEYDQVVLGPGDSWETVVRFIPFAKDDDVSFLDGIASVAGKGKLTFGEVITKIGKTIPPPKTPPPIVKGEREKIKIARKKSAGKKQTRILILSIWDYGNAAWGDEKEFPEIANYVKQLNRVNPEFTFKRYFGQIIYSHRWAFRARDNFQYFLKDFPEYKVDVAYEDDFINYLKNLYDYDILVVNDFNAQALAPYIDDLYDYVKSGHGLIFMGGYQAYGGRGADFGNWKALEKILPVTIATVPDFVNQTPYDREKKLGGRIDSFKIRKCPYCSRDERKQGKYSYRDLARRGPWITCDNLWNSDSFRWINEKIPVNSKKPEHPITAGIPWNSISPDYHKVAPKPGTEVVAEINDSPVIALEKVGKGRLAAVTICDERRFYHWPYSRKFFKNLVDWCSKRKPKVVMNVRFDQKVHEIVVEVHNHSEGKIDDKLMVVLRGKDFKEYFKTECKIALNPDETKTLRFKTPIVSSSIGYRVEAVFNGITAFASADPVRSDEKRKGYFVDFRHHHCWRTGEKVKFKLELEKDAGFEKVSLKVYDKHGELMFQQKDQNPGKIIIPSDDWAVGDYMLKLIFHRQDGSTSNHIEGFTLVREKNFFVPISWGGDLPIYFDNDCFASFAAAEKSKDYGTNWIGLYHGHMYEKMDSLLKMGIRASLRTGQSSYTVPLESESIKFLEEFTTDRLAGYSDYPALTHATFDDEGTSYWWNRWPKQNPSNLDNAFQEKYGRPLRRYPETKQEKVDLADFYDASYNNLMKTCVEIARKIRPDIKCHCVISPFHSGLLGSYIPMNFKNLDIVDIDGYPITVNDIGQDLLQFNTVRTIAERENKPTLTWKSEYRNSPDSIRSQVWLWLLTGMKGIRWYAFGGGERTGVYRKEVVDTISPLDNMIADLAPLIAKWRPEKAKIAVLYSRDLLAECDPKEEIKKMFWVKGGSKRPHFLKRYGLHKDLWEIFVILYQNDLTADVLSSEDMENGKYTDYDAIVVTHSDKLLDGNVEKMNEFGKDKLLVQMKSEKYDKTGKLHGTKPLKNQKTLSKLAKIQSPSVITPDKNVFSGLMKTDGIDFVVLYNHGRKAQKTKVIIRNADKIRKIIDVLNHNEILFKRNGDTLSYEVEINPYNGRILALLPVDDYNIEIDVPETMSSGDDETLELSLTDDFEGPVVVDVDLFNPSGVKTGYSDKYMIENGELEIPLSPGKNALKGKWRISVNDRFSGKTSARTIDMK